MRTIRTAFAAMIAALSLLAFESDADAQARRESRSASVTKTNPSTSKSSATVSRSATQVNRNSSQVNRSSSQVNKNATQNRASSATRQTAKPSTAAKQPATAKPSASTRPAGTVSRPTSGATDDRKPSTTVARPATRPAAKPATKPAAKPSDNGGFKSENRDKPVSVTRPGNRPAGNAKPADRPAVRPDAGPTKKPADRKPSKPVQIRPDHKPDVHRVHPRDRDYVVYNAPSFFWSKHNHCYGHRVRVLPAHVRRHVFFGITYYCYNDIWYRPYGGYYIVCRPPRGTVLAANLIADMAWTAVKLSYYNTVANTYKTINENNEYIAQQNAIIAQNNATIAAQNQTIAMNQQLASQAYTLANELGLVQSYAAADGNYYYQDGVFYTMDSDGEYEVILPPAGALVETLPEDYDMVTLNGDEYYQVDETVYKVTINEGKPYFEVLGQLYS